MRHLFFAGAVLGLLALATPAGAMPIGKIAAPGVANDDAAIVQVRYRHHYRTYTYRPRTRYVYRNYGYDGGYRRSYGYYGGGPGYYGGGYGPGYYGGGYGPGYYGGGPSIGFSFGIGR